MLVEAMARKRTSGDASHGDEVLGADPRAVSAIAKARLLDGASKRKARREAADDRERAARRGGAQSEGKREERPRQVLDPYADYHDTPDGKFSVVTVNVRETPIEHMFARKEISFRLKKAADRFRATCEAARIGSAGVIDPARIKVDTSGGHGGIREAAVNAAKQLAQLQGQLGRVDFDMLVQACTVGLSMQEITDRWFTVEPGTAMAKKITLHVGQRIKVALVVTAQFYGLSERQSDQRHSARPRFYRSFSGLSSNPNDWKE